MPAKFQRVKGTDEVFDVSTGQPRHVSFQEAQQKKLFGSGAIEDVASIANLSQNQKLTPSKPRAITPESLQPEEPLPIQGTSADVFNVQGLESAFLAPTQQEQRISEGNQQLQDLFGQLTGQSEFRAEQEQQFGVDKAQADIRDLNARLTALKNEALSIPIKEELRAQQQGTFTKAGFQANVNQKLRENAIQALSTSSLMAASQGQLANAQSLADRAVAQKYDPILEQIDVTKANLDLIISDPLTSLQDKNRAIAQKEFQDKKIMAAEKAAERDAGINKLMLQAASVGADPQTLDKIKNSYSVQDAIKNSGDFLSAEFRQQQEQIKFDNDIKLQGLAMDRARLAMQQTSLQLEREAAQNSGLDEAGLLAFAQQYASTGKIPTGMPKGTFGMVSEIAKSLPKEAGALVDKNTGTKPDASDAAIRTMGALYSAVEMAKELKKLEEERVGGLVGGTVGKVFGADDQNRYLELRTQITDIIARARSGAALTEFEFKNYGDMLPGRFSNALFLGRDPQDQIDSFINTLSSDLKNHAEIQGWAIHGMSEVTVGDKKYTVGDVLENESGIKARVGPDGSLLLLQ